MAPSNIIVNDRDVARAAQTRQLISHALRRHGPQGKVLVHVDEEAIYWTERHGADGLMKDGVIYLNPGAYCPRNALGRALLGHELVHVIQWTRGHTASSEAFSSLGEAEAEAELLGIAFSLGGELGPVEHSLPPDCIAAGRGAANIALIDSLLRGRLANIDQTLRDLHAHSSLIALRAEHDGLFEAMGAGGLTDFSGYAGQSVHDATLGNAIYEALAVWPYFVIPVHGTRWVLSSETALDQLSAGLADVPPWVHPLGAQFGQRLLERVTRARQASMGPFQAYPDRVIEALSNPVVRRWIREYGDRYARDFVRTIAEPMRPLDDVTILRTARLAQGSRFPGPLLIRRDSLMGEQSELLRDASRSPLLRSRTLTLVGKMQLTLNNIREVDNRNPFVRRLTSPQQLRIWMDYETNCCDHGYYARGEFESACGRATGGEMVDLRSDTEAGSSQRLIFAYLGVGVWPSARVPRPRT